MKRRTFLSTTGVVGLGMGTGIASTTGLLVSSPWRYMPELGSDEISHLDGFAGELRQNFTSIGYENESFVQSLVMPKDIVSQKRHFGGYRLVFKNSAASCIHLEKKGNKVKTIITSG